MKGFVVVMLMVTLTCAKLFTLEVEKFAPASMRMPRSGASGNFTVLMRNGDFMHISVCLRVATFVRIRNVVFSNDGGPDAVRTLIDDRQMGTFQTSAVLDDGNGWNNFRSSGELDGKAILDIGRHTITLRATTDKWGIEIDNVVLIVGDEHLKLEDLLCNLYCFDINYDSKPKMNLVPRGRFVQKSVSTHCTEQDNVKVQLFHETANHFDVIANLPKYVSFANNKKPVYDNCVLSTPYWIFKDQTVSQEHGEVTAKNSKLSFAGSNKKIAITVTFNLRKMTPTRELDERFVNSVLYVKMRNMHRENVKIKPEYKKNGEWISLQVVEFTPFSNDYTWTFPDRTWDILEDNIITLYIEPGQQQVLIDTMKLESQPPPDTTIDLYADSNTVYQAVRFGFWQHWTDSPDSMTVLINNGNVNEHHKVDSIRIYAKVPWTGGYSQVFVLYQDGRVRIQTVTPHGLDYVPFGSSINIGQPESVNSLRPYSPIKKIVISPRANSMIMEYNNGNRATLILDASFNQTTLKIRDCVFKKDRHVYPLITIKSMWISDGNSHTDHVTIDGQSSHHVMSEWREIFGSSAVFFRKCISAHNTQAPDITVKIVQNSEH